MSFLSISFLLGRSGMGKTSKLLEEMLHKTRENPQGDPIIYLVPDQMTFQSEMQLISSTQKGMTRVQVLSFSRLALRTLQETGGISRQHIQSTGIQMVLRKIVESEKQHFSVFGKTTDTNGFIEQLEQMISELKRYDITSESLREKYDTLVEKQDKKPQEKILQEKLHDISIIYNRLQGELAEKYLGSEDYLKLLSQQIPKSTYLNKATVIVDGFHSFTPLELLVIEQLVSNCRNVTFSLTLDKHYEIDEHLQQLDLFFETARTYQKIRHTCRQLKLDVKEPVILKDSLRYRSHALKHLEQYYDVRPTVQSVDNDGIFVIGAVHRRSEVEGVAREILHLVRDKSYRFQDMALLLRNTSDYGDLLETVFAEYNIPLFMDQKRSMLNHPVIEFIRSSLEIIQGHWRYEAVFRCFKTDMLFPLSEPTRMMRERVDKLENYVLSYGIQGARWVQKDPWIYRRVRTSADEERNRTAQEDKFEKEINELRAQLTTPLIWLEKKMKKATSLMERCEVLYHYLEMCDIPKKLEILRDKSLNEEDLQSSREHDQVWSAIIDLMDEMVEMAGDETMSFSMFRNMLDTGLEGLKFSIIPPAMDQVIVADMEHSRLTNIRCGFMLGVNEGTIPAKPNEGGIISEEEREKLAKDGMSLAPSSTMQLLNESFLIYMAQSIPSERLYLTFPLADEEGRSLQPSIILKRVKDLFPSLEEKLWFHEPVDTDVEEQFQFISNPRKTLSYVASELQSWKKGYSIPTYWWDVYNWYASNNNWHFQTKQVLHSLFYENKANTLSNQVSRELYGDHIQTSVSRMEQYQNCAFAQFATYGLSLRERETYKLEAPDIGTLFHAALKGMADHLKKNGRDFSQLTKEECAKLAKHIVNELAPKIQREILLSSNRYNYIKKKLEDVVARASSVLSEHSKSSGFSPVGLEIAFGPNEELPPLQFKLENGCTMELIGRIDRVDRAESEDGVLLRVIDYKSSKKDVDLMEVYYGLSLQMLIYLDVVVSFSEKWLGVEASPAGVLYFHVHNPLIQAQQKMEVDELEAALFKEFKMKGLISANPEVARLMDNHLEDGKSSNIIPAQLKKDGGFSKNSSVISNQEYITLKNYLRKKVEQIGLKITDGAIDINPMKTKQKTACTYCSFASVCQFDPTLETNDYNRLGKIDKKDVVNKMEEEGGEIVED
ncbi:helicase-exonuclease AddAB subunit AddB [Evansella sp. AB-rgal1]|uniref:helicase-exonuclease AddAB subunit AddB n=1 Tax=Evansella sp. AB-rgal1 TaxID=3242696 RepID=UPI00359F056C